MRKSVAVLIGAVLGAALTTPALMKTESVTGQLIDLACYAQDKSNTGNQHKNRGLICARACAREGFPVGLLLAASEIKTIQ